MVRTGEGCEIRCRNWKGCMVLWELNVMRCEKRAKLKNRSVRSRSQGVSVVGWVDVWEWGELVWCMVGLLGAGCGGMWRGCVGVGRLRVVVQSSGGVVVLSIEKFR